MSLADREPTAKVVGGSARILTIDIERLPGTAYAWEPKTRYIPPHNWLEWPRLLCFAARWHNDDRMLFHAEWHKRDMLEAAWKLLDEADIVVGYNSASFDMRHLKAEMVEAGHPPPRPWKDVDLYRIIKRHFGWESKSLDSVTRRLGRDGKPMHYSIPMAVAASEGDKEAQRQLKFYNSADVELTEWLASRLRGWLVPHPHVGSFGDERRCPQCGSDDLELQPSRYKAVLLEYAMYRCGNCQGLCRGSWESRQASTRGVS